MIEYPYVVVLEGEEPYDIMAPDDEQAAWNALSLSESLGCPLLDVYRREKEFPNNWQNVSDTPSEEFAEIDYELLMNMMMMWEIPSSHCCIMRCENKSTGKISEFSYQRLHAAKRKLVELAMDDDNEILVADEDSIALFKKGPHPSSPLLMMTILSLIEWLVCKTVPMPIDAFNGGFAR